MRTILKSIKKSLKEISPFENIRVLGSNPKGDILAGITVAIIALPLALAFGEISKLGPIAGIWGAIAGGIFGGFFGLWTLACGRNFPFLTVSSFAQARFWGLPHLSSLRFSTVITFGTSNIH